VGCDSLLISQFPAVCDPTLSGNIVGPHMLINSPDHSWHYLGSSGNEDEDVFYANGESDNLDQ